VVDAKYRKLEDYVRRARLPEVEDLLLETAHPRMAEIIRRMRTTSRTQLRDPERLQDGRRRVRPLLPPTRPSSVAASSGPAGARTRSASRPKHERAGRRWLGHGLVRDSERACPAPAAGDPSMAPVDTPADKARRRRRLRVAWAFDAQGPRGYSGQALRPSGVFAGACSGPAAGAGQARSGSSPRAGGRSHLRPAPPSRFPVATHSSPRASWPIEAATELGPRRADRRVVLALT